jgi:O-antigen ligase
MVWSAYWREVSEVSLFGAGPGSFTGPSPITIKLALELRALGSIFSPHSFLLGTWGELGLPGLAYTAFLFFYLAVVLPMRSASRFAVVLAAVAATTMLQGMGETLDVGNAGPTWFLLGLLMVACNNEGQLARPGSNMGRVKFASRRASDPEFADTRPFTVDSGGVRRV